MGPLFGVRIGKKTVTFLGLDDKFLGAVRLDQIESIEVSFNNNNNMSVYTLMITLLTGTVKKMGRKRRGSGRIAEIENEINDIAEEITQAIDDLI